MARTIARPAGLGDGQNRWVLYGSIGLAVIAALFAFISLRTLGGGNGASTGATVDVVVASQRIDAGSEISADMLKVAAISENSLIESGLTSVDGLVGLVARYPIEAGQQVTQANFGQEAVGCGDLGCVVPDGMRGVSVSVTEETVFGGLLSPGDRVDVIAIVSRTVGDEDVPTAITLVENVEVLAVGEEQLEQIASLDANGEPIVTDTSGEVIATTDGDVESQPDAPNVALAVFPQDVARLVLAQEEGSISLSLRGPSDGEILRPEDSILFPNQTGGSSESSGSGN